MQVSVQANGSVTIANPTAVRHGVEWVSAPAEPHCTGVPVGTSPAASAATWSGSCTFSKAGEYVFYCTVHGPSMTGRIVVSAAGETTTTNPPTTTTSPPTATTGGGSSPSSPGYESAAPPPRYVAPATSLLASSASSAVKIAASQRGDAVRGSVAVSPAGAGSRLEVVLLARSAAIAGAGHSAAVTVGRVIVGSVHAGSVSFAVPLSRTARKALARHRRLPVSVRVTLRSPGANELTVTRSVLLHA